jgi:hypothetical protein
MVYFMEIPLGGYDYHLSTKWVYSVRYQDGRQREIVKQRVKTVSFFAETKSLQHRGFFMLISQLDGLLLKNYPVAY